MAWSESSSLKVGDTERRMLQAVMTKSGEIEFRKVDRLSPKDDQVLVQVRGIGVCGSDIHV